LPFAIQTFFNELSIDCQVSKTNSNIKPFHSCLLRHGVENSETQSFISCIASALFYGDKDENTKKNQINKFIPDASYDVPSIEIMKELIIRSISLDKFITYQNGDLISIFSKKDINVNEELYYNSKLYKKIQKNEFIEEQKLFFQNAVKAFENFKLFLNNKSIIIDYTYLWDIICNPNPILFENGINLIILEILDNDITNNVEFICPTNHYSNNIYDSRKRTLILIKQNNYFEPLYSYKNEEKRISIIKTFSEYDPHLSKNVKNIFRKIIKPILKDKCGFFLSRSNTYKFKSPILLDKLIFDLIKKEYNIENQVLNFQGKVIGIICKNKKGIVGFIPCYPSSLSNIKFNEKTIDFIYMSDVKWNTYLNTLNFLKEYYKYKESLDNLSGKCIDGTDLCKVVEDNMVVGFLTNTNQFVQISVPMPISNINDNIKSVTNNNYLIADLKIQTSDNVDDQRVDYIKRIELETVFYNVFRNTIRILLNDYSNSEKRKIIYEECNKELPIYTIQLKKVIELLKDLSEDFILFAINENGFNYGSINDIYTCITNPIDKCKSKSNSNICMTTGDKCSVIIPKINLITDTDNEEYYFGKMADELIRYNRIKTFIFQPQSYLSFRQLKYNLNNNEIIILQSLLTPEYFDQLISTEINLYAKYNTFDNTEPIISQPYSNELIINENVQNISERDCFPTEPSKISSNKWKTCFPKTFKEIEYNGSKFCGIYLIIDLIKQYKNIDLTIDEIKTVLFNEYKNYTNNFEKKSIEKIANILIEEGKVIYGSELKIGTLTIIDMIFSNQFYLTSFDLWIILNKYQIPSMFISSFLIPQTRFNDYVFVCCKNNSSDSYVFIVLPALREKEMLIFKIIVNNDNQSNISLSSIDNLSCKNEIISSIEKYINIEEFITLFKKDVKTKYKQRKPGVRPELIEFEIIGDAQNKEQKENPIENTTQNVIKKKIPLNKTFIIQEETNVDVEKPINDNNNDLTKDKVEIDIISKSPEEKFEIEIKPKKTKKRKLQMKTNPQGKTKTKKNITEFEILPSNL